VNVFGTLLGEIVLERVRSCERKNKVREEDIREKMGYYLCTIDITTS